VEVTAEGVILLDGEEVMEEPEPVLVLTVEAVEDEGDATLLEAEALETMDDWIVLAVAVTVRLMDEAEMEDKLMLVAALDARVDEAEADEEADKEDTDEENDTTDDAAEDESVDIEAANGEDDCAVDDRLCDDETPSHLPKPDWHLPRPQ
jgi:hypothetical protein